MLRATAAIANGGTLLQPQIVKKISNSDGTVIKEFGPQVVQSNIVDPSVIQTVQSGMRMAVTEGSAKGLADLPVTSAGKTGTAQFLDNQKTHAWFEAYAPYDNPQIAVIAMVEGGGGGHEIALPIAKDILNYYFTR
jgi:cell division protein FtsI/penicillin-binding protein 2